MRARNASPSSSRTNLTSGRSYRRRSVVCLARYSYCGYSALASRLTHRTSTAAPSPGVADLPHMLSNEARQYGRNQWAVACWHQLICDSKSEREKLKEISCAKYADRFQAPVLLIRGDDDTVVPLAQSQPMHRRLEKAGKSVVFVRLRGEDH
ncbi:MAG: prolyl oligopeptidase family serine peptidase [Pseudomonadota bacterium]